MRVFGSLLAVALACAASAQGQAQPGPSMNDILEQSPASDWRTLDPENTLYLDLPRGRVIIELAPGYAPNHVANIRALARARYWDGAAIVRAQDNYVVQWGRDEGDTTPMGEARASLQPEFDRPRRDVEVTRLRDEDSYAAEVGFSDGFPVASTGQRVPVIGRGGRIWMTHCYGMVGAGRGDTADSGSGAELYVVIGQAPRHLDRNVTLVGRVVQGMELLSVLPRGSGALGFYETPQERTPIRSVRLAADVPAAQRVNLEALRTESATFRRLIENRRTRRDGWFIEPTGRINVCNVPLPVRVQGS
jgi:peptidylprolyl isomerase